MNLEDWMRRSKVLPKDLELVFVDADNGELELIEIDLIPGVEGMSECPPFLRVLLEQCEKDRDTEEIEPEKKRPSYLTIVPRDAII